jgi:hypothetical protein
MAKINLLDFSDSYKVDGRATKGDYWNVSSLSRGYTDNVLFESAVIDKIICWTDWKSCPEYELLHGFFKKGGKLEDTAKFYNEIEKLKGHNRGCDLVYAYAKNVIKGRLPSGVEGKYLKGMWNHYYSSRSLYKYAKYVIRGRLPVEYEAGCNDLDYLGFLESKGIDISEVLINSSELSYHYYRKFCYLPEVIHNFMLAMQLSGDYYANGYFKQRRKDDKLIKNRLKMVDPNKTVKEIMLDLK